MKKIINIILVLISLILLISNTVTAHGGNITGWKEQNSENITKYQNEYYGYHKKDGIKHYHKVKWNKEKKKWEIIDSNTYYNSKFEEISLEQLNKQQEETTKVEITFLEAVDGDTAKFMKQGEKITVRFLAIDTPETVHPNKEIQPYGKQASDLTKERLENAHKIILEYDNNADKKDKYGRELGWIWIDGKLLQKELVEKGLAQIKYITGKYKYLEELENMQKVAQENKLGIWENETQEAEQNGETVENSIQNKDKNVDITSKWKEISIGILIIIITNIMVIIKRKKKQLKNK